MSPALCSAPLDFTLLNETRGSNVLELVCQHSSTLSPLAAHHPVWEVCLQYPNPTASLSMSLVKPWSSPRRSHTLPPKPPRHTRQPPLTAFPLVLCYHSQIAIFNFFFCLPFYFPILFSFFYQRASGIWVTTRLNIYP